MWSDLAFLKPWLTAIVLPPGGPLLALLLGLGLALRARRVALRAIGQGLFGLSVLALWLLSCQGTAVHLEQRVLKPPPALNPSSVQAAFQASGVQAIVVLGGGLHPAAAEYGAAQLSESSAQRLHYGATLARASGRPLAFSGGLGWAAAGRADSEAAAAERWLSQIGLPSIRWQDSQSRDTAGNAQAMSRLLRAQGISSIALVTHASHMPRALREFESTGLRITAAPTTFLGSDQGMGLDWFPSAQGLRNSRRVLHEILGLWLISR